MVERPLRLFLLGLDQETFDYDFSSNGEELFCVVSEPTLLTEKRLTFFDDGVFLSGTNTRLDIQHLRHHKKIWDLQ